MKKSESRRKKDHRNQNIRENHAEGIFDAGEILRERYKLALERTTQIVGNPEAGEPFDDYMMRIGSFFLLIDQHMGFLEKRREREEQIYTGAEMTERVGLPRLTRKEGESWQDELYASLREDHYPSSYLCPDYAVRQLGEKLGGILSAFAADLLALVPWIYEGRLDLLTIYAELFVMLHGDLAMAEDRKAAVNAVRDSIYWFYRDYSEIFTRDAVMNLIDPSRDFLTRIVMESDLNDLSYLYSYGSPIRENELAMAAYLNRLSEEEIRRMADTYTEGYRIGFRVTGKDLSIKSTVKLEYPIGMERMVRQAICNFRKMGLAPVLVRESILSIQGRGKGKRGVYSCSLNRQFDYDHKNDLGYYLDAGLNQRRLEVMQDTVEKHKKLARGMGGPAVIDVFGQPDFKAVNSEANYHYSPRQQGLNVSYAAQAGQITNRYIVGKERSFTMIAFPLPSIGDKFDEIFAKTMEINTLDYHKYQTMQQKMIDLLDQGERVHVRGQGGNRTDITVELYKTADPGRMTKFENCVADVNIPVGEVFTSPVLEGTNGILHVSHVYLDGMEFKDLQLTFRDGMVADYSCGNFKSREEGRRLIEENILYHHKSLPMGEFAIGTNTTAYRMAKDYGIGAKLPILIAEKTGPHFAVGDTCYSHEEDNRVYNPDGKEIVAKENSISSRRVEDPTGAYFGCHTDITIPFEELEAIEVILADGRHRDIIREGKFVVPGTEELNLPLTD